MEVERREDDKHPEEQRGDESEPEPAPNPRLAQGTQEHPGMPPRAKR